MKASFLLNFLAVVVGYAAYAGAEAEKPCFLLHAPGDSYVYNFEVDHEATQHAAGPGNVGTSNTHIHRTITASVTLIGTDELAGLHHFELNVIAARETVKGQHIDQLLEKSRESGLLVSKLEEQLQEHPFFFAQDCVSTKVARAFSSPDETHQIFSIKQSLIETIAHDSLDSDVLEDTSYVADESDHFGEKRAMYEHEVDDESGELHVTYSHEHVRTIFSRTARQHDVSRLPVGHTVHKRTKFDADTRAIVHSSHYETVQLPAHPKHKTPGNFEHGVGGTMYTSKTLATVTLLNVNVYDGKRKRTEMSDIPASFRAERPAPGRYIQSMNVYTSELNAVTVPKTAESFRTLLGATKGARVHDDLLFIWLTEGAPQATLAMVLREVLLQQDLEHPRAGMVETRGELNSLALAVAETASEQIVRDVLLNIAVTKDAPYEARWTALFALAHVPHPTEELLETVEDMAEFHIEEASGNPDVIDDYFHEHDQDLSLLASMVHGSLLNSVHARGDHTAAYAGRARVYGRLMKSETPLAASAHLHALGNAMTNHFPREYFDDFVNHEDIARKRVYPEAKRAFKGKQQSTEKRQQFAGDMLARDLNECAPAACSRFSYQNVAPTVATEEHADTLGSWPFFAYYEGKIDQDADASPELAAYYKFFMGGIIGVTYPDTAFRVGEDADNNLEDHEWLAGTSVLVAAYGKTEFFYESYVTTCTQFKLESFVEYFGHTFYFRARAQQGCEAVESTCAPVNPDDSTAGSAAWTRQGHGKEIIADNKVIWSALQNEDGGYERGGVSVKAPIIGEIMVYLELYGTLGFDWDFTMVLADENGGTAFNGYIRPWGGVRVSAGAAVRLSDVWNALTGGSRKRQDEGNWFQGIVDSVVDNLGIGVFANIQLIDAKLPVIGMMNANTLQSCVDVGFESVALGGELLVALTWGNQRISDYTSTIDMATGVLMVEGQTTDLVQVSVLSWPGIPFETDLLKTRCCTDCAQECNPETGFCNYEVGECECNMFFSGPDCDIECPPECDYPQGIPPGVICEQPSEEDVFLVGARHTCRCTVGSYGRNCMAVCPPGEPLGRTNPCSGHGVCITDVAEDAVLQAHEHPSGYCECDYLYFPEGGVANACTETCPFTDEVTGERCGGNGRCMYTPEKGAHCVCYANFVGADCDAKCPASNDLRSAPCSRRGDCELIDGHPVCVCHIGYSGDVCQYVDLDGSGSALQCLNGAGVYINNTRELDRIERQGTVYTGFWMAVDAMPEARATLFEHKNGRVQLKASGDVVLCSDVDADCSPNLPTQLVEGKWYYVAIIVEHVGDAFQAHVRVYDRETESWIEGDVWTGTGGAFAQVKGQPLLCRQFTGRLDMVAVLWKPSNTAEGTAFSQLEIDMLKNELVPREQPFLMYYSLFDLKRGDHLYDQVNLARGRLSSGNAYIEDSDVAVHHSSINSVLMPPLEIETGLPITALYQLNFGGRKVVNARFAYAHNFTSGGGACQVSLTLNGVSVISNEPVIGVGDQTYDLSREAEELLIDSGPYLADGSEGVWTVTGAGCKGIIKDSHLEVTVPAVDTVLDMEGSPYSFGEMNVGYSLSGAWSMEVWMYRDEMMWTDRGLIAILQDTDNVWQPRQEPVGTFRWHEAPGAKRGVRVAFDSGKTLHFQAYVGCPMGQWCHHVISMEHTQVERCKLRIYVDGRLAIAQRPNDRTELEWDTVECGSSPHVTGFTPGTSSNFRIGPGFAGKMNDFAIYSTAQNNADTVRRNMRFVKDFSVGSWLAAYSFDNFDQDNDEIILDSSGKSANDGVATAGTFRLLVYGSEYYWADCPGTSYQSPEAVCSTRSIYEHGYCKGSRDDGGKLCGCNEGFFGNDCSGTCVGAPNNICSGHGSCISLNETLCLCETGYTGPGCEFECPGWSDPRNQPRKECLGHGQCSYDEDGGSVCICDEESGRYGFMCEFTFGEDPEFTRAQDCRECDGPHEVCIDGVCACDEGFYRWFSICRDQNGGTSLALSSGVLAAVISVLATFAY